MFPLIPLQRKRWTVDILSIVIKDIHVSIDSASEEALDHLGILCPDGDDRFTFPLIPLQRKRWTDKQGVFHTPWEGVSIDSASEEALDARLRMIK